LSAQTSGCPSGTVKSAASTARRNSGSSWHAITVWTAATHTYPRPPFAAVASIQSSVPS
jgi:hypothetical protein